jgi:hypothetical protein
LVFSLITTFFNSISQIQTSLDQLKAADELPAFSEDHLSALKNEYGAAGFSGSTLQARQTPQSTYIVFARSTNCLTLSRSLLWLPSVLSVFVLESTPAERTKSIASQVAGQ